MEGLDMRTIAIINQKGGCGKTTTSINLAACLARLGQKTLLIDMDPQGHCGVGLAVPEEQIDRTIFDALVEPADARPARLNEIVWQIATDFDLVPANIKLAGFEQLFAGREGRDLRLREAMECVSAQYKWCIIDCPPSVGLLTFNALQACDEVIVPVETGFFSLHGLSKMMQTLEMLKQHCGRELAVRILPTLYDTRTKLAREVLSELRVKFRDQLMQSTVNFNAKLKEAASFGQPITEYDPGSRGYKDFVNLARELMGHRPDEVEVVKEAPLSRPAELVKRAKQLSQLTNYQFGRNTVPAAAPASDSAEPLSAPSPEAARATDRKIADFYGAKQMDGEVVFAARFNQARKVLIAGDFNNWSPMSTPMQGTDRSGEWSARLPLSPGRYRYRLVVDGRWMTDPNNEYVEENQFGELNNVIEVQ
jgi:chromosome partitioning protein